MTALEKIAMVEKPAGESGLAPIRNMAIFNGLIKQVTGRATHLPGMACFYGPSGYGKTFAATWGRSRSRGFYVQLGSTSTKKTLVMAIANELGLPQRGSLPELMASVKDGLALYVGRVLIIDEADYLLEKHMIDLVREIHDGARASIILIGEEHLPGKLKDYERAHNRMLNWVAALPCDLQDARQLAIRYLPGISIDDELLGALLTASAGRARRIVVNLERVKEHANTRGCRNMTLRTWGSEEFFTGEPPKRRVV